MKLYTETEQYKLYEGSMLDMLDVIPENSIDAIVTDPPYELNFMNKGWDRSGIAFQKETWEKCLKVLKPGGYLLSFGGSRTFHRIACAIEDAGFEIRDTVMWLYGSGFPKSMNIGLSIDKKLGYESTIGDVKLGHEEFVGRTTDGHMRFENGMDGFDRPWMHDDKKREEYHYQKVPTSEEAKIWDGWGTALKPAYESITVARKPCEGSTTDNVLKYGVGGINIDECRVPANPGEYDIRHYTNEDCFQNLKPKESKFQVKPQPNGRFPANVILTYNDSDVDEVCGGFPNSGSGNGGTPYNYSGREYNNKDTSMFNGDKPQACSNYNDNGSAARYFYCAKASRLDRDDGLCGFRLQKVNDGRQTTIDNAYQRCETLRFNNHPCVKPTSLMQYLVRLISPKGSTILDPFNGSGSTGKAVMFENRSRNANYKYIGIDLSEEYLQISKARIDYAMVADMTIDETGKVKLDKQDEAGKSKPKQFNLFEI